MGTQTLFLELPEEVVSLLGSPEAAVAKAKEALVIELLREARISQGLAAQILEVIRWEILDLMAEHHVPSGPATEQELRREFEQVDRWLQERNLRIIGCGGVLLLAKNLGMIDTVRSELDRLRATGLYLSDVIYRGILVRAGEA
ncbi:MAG: UPF0175 family protein [Dehalococcoidia bacterium]